MRHSTFSLSLATVLMLSTGCLSTSGGESTAELEELRAELAELQSREEIRELFTDYGRTLDDRDFTAFGQLFARESEYIGAGGVAQGPDEIAALLDGAITGNLTGANLHMFVNEKIEVEGASTEATAVSRGAFVGQDDAGSPTPLVWATYVDELVLEDGRWKFSRREVVGDIPGPPNGTSE